MNRLYHCSAFENSCIKGSPDCSLILERTDKRSYMGPRFYGGKQPIKINCTWKHKSVYWSFTHEDENGQQLLAL